MFSSFTMLGREVKDLLRCSSGQTILQAVLDSPMVQRSRSFGFAETVSNTLWFAWLASG